MKFLIPLLLLTDIALAQIAVSEARWLHSGKVITVNGTVSARFGDLAFIQDPTGGIAIYNADVAVSDSISIKGKLSKHNGMLEIVADSVAILGTGYPVSTRLVNSLYEHEGELVRIDNVRLEPKGLFFYPQRQGIMIKDADTLQYWIDDNTDIPGYVIPGTTSITGVVGRFGNELQLLPRSHEDIRNAYIDHQEISGQFTVMNWNIEFFGASRYGPSDDSLQIANVAEVLRSSQPDIVALQEVSDDEAFQDLLRLLPGYEGRCSSRYSYSFDASDDFPPQRVCFIYKTSTVKVVREKLLFRKWFDDHPSDAFSSGRLPYWLEVDAMERRLVLVNFHAKSGADESDLARREYDARLLQDSLEANRDLILLGDLNDDVDESIVPGHKSPYSNFVEDTRYFCISRILSDEGWHSTISYDDMIDHQIVTIGLKERHISTRILSPFRIPLYARTTSDHLPVVSEFDLRMMITGIVDRERPLVYPNPTSGDIWFPPGSDITIVNSIGETVLKKEGAYPPISLGEYAPGLYSVVLRNQLFKIVRN